MSQKQPGSQAYQKRSPTQTYKKRPLAASIASLAKLHQLTGKLSSMVAPPPPLHQNLSKLVSARLAAMQLQRKEHALIWDDREPTTAITPAARDLMRRAKLLHQHAVKMVDKIKCSAQTNKAFRHERLVPSDIGAVGERLELAIEIRSAQGCFDNIQPLAGYCSEMGKSHEKIGGLQDTFLRQVMKFSVKPLQEYIGDIYPQMVTAYDAMVKGRDKYDSVRATRENQMQIIDQRAALERQVSMVEEFLSKMPMYQVAVAKAVDMYVRSEAHYFRQIHKVWLAQRPPDNKSRWVGFIKP